MSAPSEKKEPFRMGNSESTATLRIGQRQTPDKSRPKPTNNLPERYAVKKSNGDRVLICLEAPNLNVHIEAGLAISASVARKSPGGTIFLDGVAQCEPFLDHEHQVYNLDHHEGCVRAFTLSACEQTLVMYMKGLDLQAREWNIFANEPDLDTILATWIILNHARIGQQDATQRRILFALVRYEGVIDALGLELKELSALPPELMRKIQRVIDHLRSDEIALKKEGRWGETDFLVYTASILHKIDQIFYKASDFADYQGIEELARIDLTDQRIAAVVEADMGIYEIEPHLNKVYGQRLGVVFLKKGPNIYTVRQMDLFMPITLEEVYERLNYVDPAVMCRTQANKWGGAADIGGSPRETGTRLTPLEIAQTCREALRKQSLSRQAYRFGVTTALVSFIFLCAYVMHIIWKPDHWLASIPANSIWTNPDMGFMLTILLASALSLLFIAYCRPWQYGWIFPTGRNWWPLLLLAAAAGAAGGVWIPAGLAKSRDWSTVLLLGVVGLPLAAEMLFRSLAHGLLAQYARIQRDDTRWFISWPAAGSSLLYVGYVSLLLTNTNAVSTPAAPLRLGLSLAGAAVFGLTTAMVRERSQSIFPAFLFHMVAAMAALAVGFFF